MTQQTQRFKGKKIGNYTLVEILGSGAMSTVYKGYHEGLDRNAAIKILRPQFLDDPNFKQMFSNEAKSLAKLNHPNIVQVYDTDIIGGFPYLVTEHIEGLPLRRMIDNANQRSQLLPIKQSVRIVQRVGAALAYAHNRNMIHCDVKPSNIIVEDTGRVVLVDFGYARWVTGKTTGLTSSLRGTPAYLAPELMHGVPNKDISDIYSLGVVFYELVTGHVPAYYSNLPAPMYEPAVPPSSIVDTLPERINRIIMKATSKELDQRYDDINIMLDEIGNLIEARTDHLPTASLGEERKKDTHSSGDDADHTRITLHFLDTGQLLELPQGSEFTLGRELENQETPPDIDLTPFSDFEWGISRMHAKIIVAEDNVKIVDLGSTNGTWYRGEKLEAHIPLNVYHSDIVSLGKLKLQLLIYKPL